MNKNDLVKAVASKAGVTKKDAETVVDALSAVVTEALVAGDKVALPGIGTFETVEVAERTGTIRMGARKGETYVTPAHKAPKLKMAKALKDAVHG